MSASSAAPAPATVAGRGRSSAPSSPSSVAASRRRASGAQSSQRSRAQGARTIHGARGSAGLRSARSASAIPRRISGPSAGAATVLGALALAPAYLPAPTRGAPARSAGARASADTSARGWGSALDALLARIGALASGRIWIALIGVLLVGVVGLQVAILHANQEVGRSLEVRGSLERGVAQLQVEDSALSSSARIESEAARLGMVPVGEGHTTFLAPVNGTARVAAQLLARGVKAGSAAQSTTEAQLSAQAPGAAEAQAPGAAEAQAQGAAEAQAPGASQAQAQGASQAQAAAQTPSEEATTNQSSAGAPSGARQAGESQAQPGAQSSSGAQAEAQPPTATPPAGSEAAASGQASVPGAREGGTTAGG